MQASSIPRIAALTLGLAACAVQAASSPDPGDYVPAPAGTTLGILYGQHHRGDDVYVRGDKVAGDVGLRLDIGVARLVHYIDVGGRRADLQLIQPFGRQKVSGSDALSGIGNLTFGGTVWTYSDDAAGEHLGWSGFLTVPSGAKRGQGFGLSEDRYALDLNVGYVRQLAPQWSLDFIGQTELYSRDKSTDVSRDPLVRAMVHLSYHLSPTSRLAFSVRQAYGAKETRNGQALTSAKNDTNLMLTWASFVTPTVNVQLQYAQDVRTRNGIPLRSLQARLVKVF